MTACFSLTFLMPGGIFSYKWYLPLNKEKAIKKDLQHRYATIVKILKGNIVDKRVWTQGMRIPAERELTKSLGVSRNTIRKAISVLINGGYLFSEVGRGTFVNSKKFWGKKNKINKAKLVGIIITDVKFDFGKKIVRGIENYLQKRGYSLILCQDHSNIEKTHKYVNTLIEHDIKGVILDPLLTENYLEDNTELVKIFEREQIPLVLIDREIPGIKKNAIITNNEEISFKAADYLLQNNHRKIVVVRNGSNMFLKRLKGVERAYKQNKIPFSNCQDIVLKMHDNINRDTEILASILKDLSDYSAIFSLNEYFGKVTLRTFSKLKKSVPEEVSFITFDHPEDSYLEDGAIAYVEQPLLKMGNKAARTVIDLIENKKNFVSQTVIKSKLIIGRSVKPFLPSP